MHPIFWKQIRCCERSIVASPASCTSLHEERDARLLVRQVRALRVFTRTPLDQLEPLAEGLAVHDGRTTMAGAETDMPNVGHVGELPARQRLQILTRMAVSLRDDGLVGRAIVVIENHLLAASLLVHDPREHQMITVTSNFVCHFLLDPSSCIFAGKRITSYYYPFSSEKILQ